MQFIFAYHRQAQAEPERNAPRAFLLGIGVLVVLLVIFLSFENADGGTLGYCLSVLAPSGLTQAIDVDNESGVDSQPNLWRSELENSP